MAPLFTKGDHEVTVSGDEEIARYQAAGYQLAADAADDLFDQAPAPDPAKDEAPAPDPAPGNPGPGPAKDEATAPVPDDLAAAKPSGNAPSEKAVPKPPVK